MISDSIRYPYYTIVSENTGSLMTPWIWIFNDIYAPEMLASCDPSPYLTIFQTLPYKDI